MAVGEICRERMGSNEMGEIDNFGGKPYEIEIFDVGCVQTEDC